MSDTVLKEALVAAGFGLWLLAIHTGQKSDRVMAGACIALAIFAWLSL